MPNFSFLHVALKSCVSHWFGAPQYVGHGWCARQYVEPVGPIPLNLIVNTLSNVTKLSFELSIFV